MHEYPINPANGVWNRKVLACDQKSLVLHDHRSVGAVSICSGVIKRADVAGDAGDPIDFSKFVSLPVALRQRLGPYHLICHLNTDRGVFATNPENLEGNLALPLFPAETRDKQVIALQATTQECLTTVQHENRAVEGNNYVWFSMRDRRAYRNVAAWLPEFLSLDFSKATQLARFKERSEATAFEDEFSQFLNVILPGRENLLAFRLLCEAKAMCQEAPQKHFGDITINAPRELSDWLTPFGKSKSDDINAVATMVSRGNKDLKEKAKAVLDAANGNGNIPIQDAVKDFLSESAKTS